MQNDETVAKPVKGLILGPLASFIFWLLNHEQKGLQEALIVVLLLWHVQDYYGMLLLVLMDEVSYLILFFFLFFSSLVKNHNEGFWKP